MSNAFLLLTRFPQQLPPLELDIREYLNTKRYQLLSMEMLISDSRQLDLPRLVVPKPHAVDRVHLHLSYLPYQE